MMRWFWTKYICEADYNLRGGSATCRGFNFGFSACSCEQNGIRPFWKRLRVLCVCVFLLCCRIMQTCENILFYRRKAHLLWTRHQYKQVERLTHGGKQTWVEFQSGGSLSGCSNTQHNTPSCYISCSTLIKKRRMVKRSTKSMMYYLY